MSKGCHMVWFSELNVFYQALIGGTFTFLLTCLGALCVLLFKRVNDKVVSIILGFSGGVMLASAFYSLLNPAIELAKELKYPLVFPVFVGLILGFLFMVGVDYILVKKTSTRKGSSSLLLTSMTIHNIPEGLCIGVAFGSISLGLENLTLLSAISLTLAIGLQNFPEGMACSLPLKTEGYSTKKSFLYGSMSAIVEPISAVIGCVLVVAVRSLLPYLLSFAAIIMILVVLNELLPEMILQKKLTTSIGFILGFLIMLLLDICL